MRETHPDEQLPLDLTQNQELLDAVQTAILQVPGVIRLEPSLLGRLGNTVNSSHQGVPTFGGQGLALEPMGHGVVVTVDVAVATPHTTRVTAPAIQQAVVSALVPWHVDVVSVVVSVLSMESEIGR